MTNKEEIKFYAYAYLDTRKPGEYIYFDDKLKLELKFDYEPFYVGKGNGRRNKVHIKEAIKIQKTGLKVNKKNFPQVNLYKINTILKIYKNTGEWPVIQFINKKLLKEKDAFILETSCIKTIGRYDLKEGVLTNLTDGGDGTSNPSKKTRLKISKRHSGKKNYNYGKKGSAHPKFGKKISEEGRQTLILLKTGKKLSKSHRAALRNGWKKRRKRPFTKRASPNTKGKINIKQYKITDPFGKIYYTTNGLTVFCQEHNLSQGCMSSVALGQSVQHKGWKCALIENGEIKISPKEYKVEKKYKNHLK